MEAQLLKVREAAGVINISLSKLYTELETGRLRSVKIGAARRIPLQAIAEYIAVLESEAKNAA